MTNPDQILEKIVEWVFVGFLVFVVIGLVVRACWDFIKELWED